MHKINSGSVILIFFLSVTFFSKEIYSQVADSVLLPRLKTSLIFFEFPYQFDAIKTVDFNQPPVPRFFESYANPGMNQSLSLSVNIFSGLHYGLGKIFSVEKNTIGKRTRLVRNLSVIFADYIMVYAPFGNGWLHEEYHRAMMARHHVSSFNEMNTFPVGAEMVSVNHIKDEDLIRFKKESPVDFIRMHVAGIEGEYLLVDRLQRNNFFYRQQMMHEFLYLFVTANSAMYVMMSSQPAKVDKLTDEMNQKEPEISQRDFTGFDFTAWVYDLYNPAEPYENRGVHPSGNGIDRYIKTTDLSNDALSYLKRQGYYQWLNMISPMMFGVRSLKFGNQMNYNFSVRHLLTPFGNDLSLHFLLQWQKTNLVCAWHQASNKNRSFPGIEIQLFDYPVAAGKSCFLLSPKIITGLQPQQQLFLSDKPDFFVFGSLRVDYLLNNRILPWFECSLKTPGWIAGNEFSGSNASFRLGLSARFYR